MNREHSVRTAHGSKLTGVRVSRASLGGIDDQSMYYGNLSNASAKKKSRLCRTASTSAKDAASKRFIPAWLSISLGVLLKTVLKTVENM